MNTAYALIRQERARQDAKWDTLANSSGCWLAVLTEEVGEVARAILEDETRCLVLRELVQVAAVAVAWIEQLQQKGIEA